MSLIGAVITAMVMGVPNAYWNIHDDHNKNIFVENSYLEQQIHQQNINDYNDKIENAEDGEAASTTEQDKDRYRKRAEKWKRKIEQENTDYLKRDVK